MKITKSQLKQIIKEELDEIIELPSDLSAPPSEAELRMDKLSASWEKLITDRILDGETGIWSNTQVVDPIDGERRLLDEFISILGNYVVSDEIDEGDAKDLVKSIADEISRNSFEPSPHEWGIAPPKWEGKPFERIKEGARAGHYKGVDVEDVGPSTMAHTPQTSRLAHMRSDELVAELQAVVAKWEPQTEEGIAYEADILEILDRWEEPLRLSAPTDRDVRRLRHSVKTGDWRQKRTREK